MFVDFPIGGGMCLNERSIGGAEVVVGFLMFVDFGSLFIYSIFLLNFLLLNSPKPDVV